MDVTQVLAGFFTIWAVVGAGWIAAHAKVVDTTVQRSLSSAAFYIGLPPLLFTSLRQADLERVFSLNVVVSLLAIGLTLLIYELTATYLWRRPLGHKVIGGFSSCYVNANNMGLPIAAYVLGDTSWVAPILMVQIIFLQPLGLSILDAQQARREGKKASWLRNLSIPFRTPLTMGVLLGILVNLAGIPIPDLVDAPLRIIGGLAVPAMLISFGISLRLGPLPGRGNIGETALISILKVLVHPLIALVIAQLVGLDMTTTLAVVVMAGLPTAQNVFVFSMRFDESVQLARDSIFITSFASIPMITALAALVHALG